MSDETRFENREPSQRMVDFLKERLRGDHVFNTTRDISEGTGLSRKVVGVRMKNMMGKDWTGLIIEQWAETVWKVTEVEHGRRGIRATV